MIETLLVIMTIATVASVPMWFAGAIAAWSDEKDTLTIIALLIPPLGVYLYSHYRRIEKERTGK